MTYLAQEFSTESVQGKASTIIGRLLSSDAGFGVCYLIVTMFVLLLLVLCGDGELVSEPGMQLPIFGP